MALFDAYRFDGKRVVVVGGATGMGAAAAELALDLGAEVVVMDVAPVSQAGVKAITANLADESSIDAAVDECGGPVHALLLCAGVADGYDNIEKINFVGHRHLIDRMLAAGMLGRGAAIGFISSAAGLGWETELEQLQEWIAIDDYDESARWAQEHEKCNYIATKRAVCAYVAMQTVPLLRQGIRINAICPGPTDTPLARANADTWLASGTEYRNELGVEISTPMEQAYPLLFVCSDAAAAITGFSLWTEQGRFTAAMTGMWPPDRTSVDWVLGRI